MKFLKRLFRFGRITKREWYAAKAMQSLLTIPLGNADIKDLPNIAFRVADAMIKESNKS